MTDASGYGTSGFMAELREWMRREGPSPELLTAVAAWEPELKAAPTLFADPDGPNLWIRTVPGTEHDGCVVTLSFSVVAKVIHCHSFRCQVAPAEGVQPEWPPAPHKH